VRCDLCQAPMVLDRGLVVCHPCEQAFDPSYFGADLWIGDCGCLHSLVADGCACRPEVRYDAEGPYIWHHCDHTDERVTVDV
jgi:hypothetical protein